MINSFKVIHIFAAYKNLKKRLPKFFMNYRFFLNFQPKLQKFNVLLIFSFSTGEILDNLKRKQQFINLF